MDFLVGTNENLTRIPAHIAIVVARSDWLRAKIREERINLNQSETVISDNTNKLEVILYVMFVFLEQGLFM